MFTNAGDVMYAISLETEEEDDYKFDSAFKTLDASDYSSIATIETRRAVLGLCPSSQDLSLAVVENSLSPAQHEESVIRLYDVGRVRVDEDEDAEGDDAGPEDEEDQGGEDGEDSGKIS